MVAVLYSAQLSTPRYFDTDIRYYVSVMKRYPTPGSVIKAWG